MTKLATVSLLLDTTVCIHGLASTCWRLQSLNVLKDFKIRAKLSCKVYATCVEKLNYADVMALF